MKTSFKKHLYFVFLICCLLATFIAVLSKNPISSNAETIFKGVNYTFEDDTLDSRNASGIKWMVNNGGSKTAVVADPENADNKVLCLSSDIANNATEADLSGDDEWFMNDKDLALNAESRYDVFQVDAYFPEPKNGGFSLNDLIRFSIYGPGGNGSNVNVFVRASGAHLSVFNGTGWSKTSIPHDKWVTIKMVFDYETFTVDLLYALKGEAFTTLINDFAIPEGWKGTDQSNLHIRNYRVATDYIYYVGNADGFYTLDKRCYIDNMQIYDLNSLDTFDKASLDKATYKTGDVITANALDSEDQILDGTYNYQWFTSANGTNYTLIEGANSKQYTALEADKFLKAVVTQNVEGTTIELKKSETAPAQFSSGGPVIGVFSGINYSFEDDTLDSRNASGIKWMLNNGGSKTAVVADPENADNKVLCLSSDIANNATEADLSGDDEWFMNDKDLALNAESRYDVFQVDAYFPEPKNGGFSLNDSIRFSIYGPGGNGSNVNVFVRASGAHLSVFNGNGWSKTNIPHDKWVTIKMVFDYETFTVDLLYALKGEAFTTLINDFAIPEGWKGTDQSNLHIRNYRVATDYIYYVGNADGFYTLDKRCYIDNLLMYDVESFDAFNSVEVDKEIYQSGDTLTAIPLDADGKTVNKEFNYEWLTSTDGTNFTVIPNENGKTYVAKDSDKYLKAICTSCVAGTTIELIKEQSQVAYMAPSLMELDFEDYEIGSNVGVDGEDTVYQANANPITVVANPDGNGQVLKYSSGALIQNRSDLKYLRTGDFVIECSYYLPEGFTGKVNTQLFSAKTSQVAIYLNGAQIYAESKKVADAPVNQWFKLILVVKGFSTGDLYMVSNGTCSLIKANFAAFSEANTAIFKTGTMTRLRIGAGACGEFYIDDLRVVLYDEITDATLINDTETSYSYDGTAKSLKLDGLDETSETLVGIMNNSMVNAGTYDVAAMIESKTAKYGYSLYKFVKSTLTIAKAEYNMSDVLFGDQSVNYDFESHTLEVTNLPEGLTVSKYVIGEDDFTGAIEAGEYEITAVLANSNPNYETPENLKATLTIVQPSLEELSDVAFEDASYPFDGESHTIQVTGLKEGYSVAYYFDGEEFSGTSEKGIYNIEARIFKGETPVTKYNAVLTILNTYDMSLVKFENKTVTYDGESHMVELTGLNIEEISYKYYVAEEEFAGAVEPGTYVVTVKFETTDTDYATPEDMTATLVINKKEAVSVAGLNFNNVTAEYDGSSHFVTIDGELPESLEVTYYVNNTVFTGARGIGIYNVEARFTSLDPHFENPESLYATLRIDSQQITTDGLYNDFEGMEIGQLEEEGQYKFSIKNEGSTGVVIDPLDPNNKVFKFSSNIEKYPVGEPYASNGEWFSGVNNFNFDANNRYDIFSVDLMFPEPKDGGLVLNDNISFTFYGAGGTQNSIRVYVRGSGAHLSKINDSSWSKTGLPHDKWINISIVFDYETNTCSMFYTIDGGVTQTAVEEYAIPEAWLGENGSHIINYRVQTAFMYYDGNKDGFYDLDKCCYMDNLMIYSSDELSPVNSIELDSYAFEAGSTINAIPLKNDLSLYDGTIAYEWYTSSNGTDFTLIYGENGSSYVAKESDNYIKAVGYVSENGMIIQTLSSVYSIKNPNVFELDFNDYEVDSLIGSETDTIYQANENPITVVANPNGEGNVLKISEGALLQNRLDLKYLLSGNFTSSVSYLLPDNFLGNTKFTIYNGRTGFDIYTIKNGNITVGSSSISYPTNEWFTVAVVLNNYNAYDVYMIVDDEISIVALDVQLSSDFEKLIKASGITRIRIGASNNSEFHINNVSVLLNKTTNAVLVNDDEVDYVYDGTAKSLTMSNLAQNENVVASSENSFVNAGTYNVVQMVEVNGTVNGISSYAFVKGLMTIEKTEYNNDFDVTFTNKEYTYDGNAINVEIEGSLPEDVTVKYYIGENELTDPLVNAGTYLVKAVFFAENPNYEAPNYLEATIVINKANYVLEGITFEDKEEDYTGTTFKLEIEGSLPEDVTVNYYVDGVLFNGASEPGTYTVTAVFTTTNVNKNNPESLTKTLTIIQLEYDMSSVNFNDVTVTYDGTAKSILVDEDTLPDGVTVTYENNGKINAGSYTITAKFTGAENYKDIPDMTAVLTINKATYDMSGINFEDAIFDYDGEKHSIRITGTLPEGVTVSYVGNGSSEPGVYTVTAKFESENANYEPIADMTATLTINEPQADEPTKGGCKSTLVGTGIFGLAFVITATAVLKRKKENE